MSEGRGGGKGVREGRGGEGVREGRGYSLQLCRRHMQH